MNGENLPSGAIRKVYGNRQSKFTYNFWPDSMVKGKFSSIERILPFVICKCGC